MRPAAALIWALAPGVLPNERTDGAPVEVVGGALDPADPSVVAVLVAPGLAVCTGALVGPRSVVTAAHCLELAPFAVFFGGSLDEDGGTIEVTQHWVHPRFDPTTLSYDVAVLELEHDAPVTPLELLRSPLDPTVVGRPVRFVGFGVDVDDSTVRHKRTGQSTIAELGAISFTSGAAIGQLCDGDSGGPVLLVEDGIERVAGLVSGGDVRCELFARHTRVDVVADFVGAALRCSDDSPESCADGGGDPGCRIAPPSSRCGAMALVIVVCALRRRLRSIVNATPTRSQPLRGSRSRAALHRHPSRVTPSSFSPGAVESPVSVATGEPSLSAGG